MPELKQFLSDPLLDAGEYPFTIKEIVAYHPQDESKASSVQYKGSFQYNDKERGSSIFRRLHENMLWQIGNDLVKLGISPDADVPDLTDADAVADFMQQFVGTTVNVRVKRTMSKGANPKEFNDFEFRGLADASSVV